MAQHELVRERAFFVGVYRGRWYERMPSWAWPACGVVLAALLIASIVSLVGVRHRERAAEGRVCEAKIEAFYLRNPVLLSGRVKWADSCAELRAITGR